MICACRVMTPSSAARPAHGDAPYRRIQGGGTELWLTDSFSKGNQTGRREPAGNGRCRAGITVTGRDAD